MLHSISFSAFNSTTSSPDNKLQDMQNALSRLDSVASDAARSRKKMAADRLEALKSRLQMLRMFPPTNSKSLAQEIARIAKEIASAVHDYADAGKNLLSSSTESAASAMSAMGDEDSKFLSLAKQLAAQAKALLDAVSKKDDRHKDAINEMDNAIRDAERTLGVQASNATFTPLNSTFSVHA